MSVFGPAAKRLPAKTVHKQTFSGGRVHCIVECRFDSYGMNYEYNSAYRVKKVEKSSVLFSKTRSIKV